MAIPPSASTSPAVSEADRLFQGLVEQSPNLILAVDAAGRVQFANATCESVLGCTPEACVGVALGDLLGHAQQTPPLLERITRVFQGERFNRVQLLARRTQGRSRRLLARMYPVPDAAGAVAACAVAATDVTPEWEARQEAARRVERSQALVEAAGAVIWRVDPFTMAFNYVSPEAEALLGYPVQRWLEEPNFWPDHIHPDDLGGVVSAIRSLREPGDTRTVEFRMRAEDGRWVWFYDVMTVLAADGGDTLEAVGIAVDVTAQREQQAAERRRERLRHHRQALLIDLAKELGAYSADPQALLERVAEVSADALDVERVNIWAFHHGGEAIKCLNCFTRTGRTHEISREVLAESRAPAYFAALEAERFIAAHDVDRDERTRELKGPYLESHGITSLLDAPIRIGGELVGVICHEHVGAPRQWTEDDKAFVASVADFLALAIESHRRREAEAAAEAAERVRAERLDQHNRVLALLARQHGATDNLDTLLHAVTEALAQVLDADRVSAWTVTEDGQRLTCADVFHRDAKQHEADAPIDISQHLALARAIHDARTVAIPDTEQVESPETRAFLRARGIAAALAAAVRQSDSGQESGLLFVSCTDEPREWEPDEQAFLGAVADFIALALESRRRRRAEAEREARERERAVQLEAHHRILLDLAQRSLSAGETPESLARRVNEVIAEVLGVDVSAVWLIRHGPPRRAESLDFYRRETGEHLSDVALPDDPESASNVSMRQHRFLQVPDVAAEPSISEEARERTLALGVRSFAAVAIHGGDDIVGYVSAGDASGPRVWTVDERSFLASVADFVAFGLEAIRRREAEAASEAAEHARAERLEQHNRILIQLAQRTLADGQTARGLASDVTEVITEALDISGAEVWLMEHEPEPHGVLLDRYHREADAHEHGQTTPTQKWAPTEDVLLEHRFIAVEDVSTHPAMTPESRGELQPGVTAFLTVSIHQGDTRIGAVNAMARGGPRKWTVEERSFLASVADFVALALETLRRREVERRLRTREAFLVRVLDTSPNPIFVKDLEGRFVLVNAPFAALYGHTADEILGKHNEDFIADVESLEAYRERDRRVFSSGESLLLPDDPQVMPGGETRWFQTRLEPVYVGARVAYVLGVAMDVTERRAREEALRAASHQAEEANRMKSALLANMSHEIRTPLTAIIGFSEILGDLGGDNPEIAEIAGLVRSSGQRLMGTLNSVLDLAQLEGGALELRPEDVDLAEEVRLTATLFEQSAREHGVTLELDLPTEASAHTDRLAFGRIVTNLLSNAIKFTPQGDVRVALALTDGDAVLTVADTGVGMSEAFLPLLFNEFKQESEGYARSHEGSGLGMAITQRLTHLMGGTIAVESEKGVGTTFTVTIPRRA